MEETPVTPRLQHPGQVIQLDTLLATQSEPDERVIPLIHPEYFAEPMTLDAIQLSSGSSQPRCDDLCDTLAYVLDGTATLVVEGRRHVLAAGYAFQVHTGETWWVESTEELLLLVFRVPAPVTPWAARLAAPIDQVIDVAHLGAQVANAATGDRQFEVLFDRNRGSRGATMFVGFIPTSGAPEHYHLYDEICVIVRGSGTLHSADSAQELRTGSSFHVAPRFLHALENPHPEDLWILGVFRPEGSAAAAYYPDGTPAPNNED